MLRERVDGNSYPAGFLNVELQRELNNGSIDTQQWTVNVTSALPYGQKRWMRDHVGNRHRRGRWPNQPCEQLVNGDPDPPSGVNLVWSKDLDPDVVWGHNNADVMKIMPFVPVRPISAPNLDGYAIFNLNDRIYAHRKKIKDWVLPRRVSIMNFLWELKDLGRLYQAVGKTIYNRADYLVDLWKNAIRQLDDLSHNTADLVLNYEYGVAPMLDDLITMSQMLDANYNRMRELSKNGGRATIRSKYTDTLDAIADDPLPSTTTFTSPDVDARVFQRCSDVIGKLQLISRVTYGTKEFEQQDRKSVV